MEIKTTKDLRAALRTPYVWPGGYPTFLITTDGGCLCMTCARENYRLVSDSLRRDDRRSGWHPAAVDVNWESLLFCDHCGKPIESAYDPIEEGEE